MVSSKSSKQEFSKIEERIIDTAIELISNKGYNEVSSREIARETGISVGTLYYHFKNGKSEILIAAARKLQKILKIDEILADGEVEDEEIRDFFYKDLDLARKLRPFLIAMEIEKLSNPEKYLSQIEKYMMIDDIKPFRRLIEGIAQKELSDDKFIKIIAIFKLLIRRHVIYRNLFGSDDDFMNLMVTIIRALA